MAEADRGGGRDRGAGHSTGSGRGAGPLDRARGARRGWAWRPILRLARRDARRHLPRTILAGALIALPVAALVAFAGFRASEAPSRERVLAELPAEAEALIISTALPQGGPPFPQLPEGAPGPWFDDPETVPPDEDALAAALGGAEAGGAEAGGTVATGAAATGTRLDEFWVSPQLLVSPEFGLAPGEQRPAGDRAEGLGSLDISRLAFARLSEAAPEALAKLVPSAAEGRLPESADEVVVTRALAEATGAEPGTALGFLAPPDSGVRGSGATPIAAMQDSERGYRVVGVVPGDGLEAWSGADWLSGLVAAHPEGISRHWLASGEPVSWEQAKRLNELQAFAVSRQVLTDYPAPGELYPAPVSSEAYLEGALGLIAAGVLGALLVLFLVTPAFAVSAEQSRRSLGLAAATGAAPRDLRRMILAQGLVLGAIGGAGGALLGIAVSIGFTAWVERLVSDAGGSANGADGSAVYSVSAMLERYPWWVVVAGVLLAVCLGALAALPPARTAARLAPVDALRDRRPAPTQPGRARRLATALAGPVLLAAAVVIGALAFALPLGPPADPMRSSGPFPAPEGAGAIQLLTVLALLLAATGLVFAARSAIAWLGRRGSRSRPAWRLALRDLADHPSRTVPAALGVLFATATAAYLVLFGASATQNFRDGDGGGIAWQGTFVVSTQWGVTADFDRLVVESAVDRAAERFPQITGKYLITGPSKTSAVDFAPLLPEGADCPGGAAGVHIASALAPGVPLRCADPNSQTAYHPGFRFGPISSWSGTMLFSGDALRATGVPGAEAAARVLDAGGVVVNNAALIDADGRVRIGVLPAGSRGAPEEIPQRFETLPGAFLIGMGAPFLMSQDTARALGANDFETIGAIAQVSAPVDAVAVRDALGNANLGGLIFVAGPDGDDPLASTPDPLSRLFAWAPVLLLALVAVTATAVSVLLSAAQGRRDAATAHAVGASRDTLRRLGVARAGAILAVGLPSGAAAGLGFGFYQVAWSRHLEASGAWLSTVPVWGAQLGITAGVAAAGLLAALIFSRPPRSLTSRRLD